MPSAENPRRRSSRPRRLAMYLSVPAAALGAAAAGWAVFGPVPAYWDGAADPDPATVTPGWSSPGADTRGQEGEGETSPLWIPETEGADEDGEQSPTAEPEDSEPAESGELTPVDPPSDSRPPENGSPSPSPSLSPSPSESPSPTDTGSPSEDPDEVPPTEKDGEG
ncbi:hypothetical protein [Salininema proteolyticum]|uniref:Uncharacterized protein n=1 Tax=Salininema proteolyticum TaxID=1607685 RepID=A0ABV8TXT7_9ACTN